MRKFTALYTHQKQKKVKAWQEGAAQYDEEHREIALYDVDNNRISSYRLRARESIELSNEYDIGRYLLTLEEEQGGEGDDAANSSGTAQAECIAPPNAPAASGSLRARRKIPSLIKPMRKRTPTGPAALPPQAVDLEVAGQMPDKDKGEDTADYSILYTTQKIKKVKAWAEGTLTHDPSSSRIVLKDDSGTTLTSSHFPKSKTIEVGGEIDHGQYLIQIESLKGEEAALTPAVSSLQNGMQLSGLLKRRHEALERRSEKHSRLNSARHPIVHRKTPTKDVDSIQHALPDPSLASSSLVRKTFVPPKSTAPKYLHFPRRSELLQHVGVSKGYNFGPSRQLVASVSFKDCSEYQKQFMAMLNENLMAELSGLAIRYFFMARERHDNAASAARSNPFRNAKSKRRRVLAGSMAQVCKSVGVLYFDDCTVRQPYMESSAFKAQLSKGSVGFSKGDSVVLELSRRENYAGYAKDDTWAISTSDEFLAGDTFLARSAFFGPSKNNTLELKLVGDEDAKVAARIFNSDNGPKAARQPKAAPSVVAIRCLDSASDWSMIDTVEEKLIPESLPILPHLLQTGIEPLAEPSDDVDVGQTLARIEVILDEKQFDLGLNSDQNEILRTVVMSVVSIYLPVENTSPVTIVHGPFGTGKSFLISAIVVCLDAIASEFPEIFDNTGSKSSFYDDEPEDLRGKPPRLRVLVSSMTNFAVDNMLSALLKIGYDGFLRVGSLRRISKQILPYVCRTSASASDDIKELETMLEAAVDEQEIDAIESAIQRVRQQKASDVLDKAFVVGTTCLSSATAAMHRASFPLVILDEACQIVEPMAMIALASAQCQRLVLVGDPLQLPPTLTTRATQEAEAKGLGRGLFDRLVQMGYSPQFLATQYRCHPRIGALCNELFYKGQLRHGVAPEDRTAILGGIPPLVFLDTVGQEKQQGKSQSFFNSGEIDMAVRMVRRMAANGVRPESIGVIALYKTQADMLRDQLVAVMGKQSGVQVSTVDAYQGSEREVIVISCVRTDKVGFISNTNRINVALSRARRHCLILGCRRLLESNSLWRRIIDYCRTDAGGLVPAQVFMNKLAEAGSAVEDIPEDAADDIERDMGVAEEPLQMERNDGHGDDCGSDYEKGYTDSPPSANLDEYNDESVVGGRLSQWSMPDVLSDAEVDALDCLDVDLDDM